MIANDSRRRLGLLAVCALSLFGALFARLWFLQVVEADAFEAQVTSNATRTVVTPAPRGRILDRNGISLVENRESIVVAVSTQKLGELSEKDQKETLERLAAELSRWATPDEAVTVDFLEKRLNDRRFSPFRPVPVAEDIKVEQEIYFSEEAAQFPAVVVERRTVRSYPYGSLAAHIVGYVGSVTQEEYDDRVDTEKAKPYEKSDEIGKAGVERTYEGHLRGTPGKRVFEVDRRGRVTRELSRQRINPVPGDDVYLSVDARIQYKTEEALQAQIIASKSPTPYGAATVLDPRNGQVIAMASYPTYDPATLVGGISKDEYARLTEGPDKIMSNRNTQEAYPAASTFKLATGYAGLKLGLVTPEEQINDTGVYKLCERAQPACRKRNAGSDPKGMVDLRKALTVSSDYYFYRIGATAWYGHTQDDKWSEDAMQEQIKVLGYGAPTGIDLTAESSGLVPTPASERAVADANWEKSKKNYGNSEAAWQEARRWKAGYSADVAIGQYSTLVTPLQTANAYASVANTESILFTPSVLDRVTKSMSPDDVVQRFEPSPIRTIDYGDAKDDFLAGFRGVTHEPGVGTAGYVFGDFPLESFSMSGKTGTAQVGNPKDKKPDNSLFVGFGPNPDNQYVASVMIQGGGFGSAAAAPATYMIFLPIADGSIADFEIPAGGAIDAQAAADRYAGINSSGGD